MSYLASNNVLEPSLAWPVGVVASGQMQSGTSLGGRARVFLRRVNPSLVIGGTLIVALLFVALLAPLISAYAPDQVMAGARLAPPSLAHPFGTDSLGRDMYSRVVAGARIAVWVMVLSTGIAALAGISSGLVSGYLGGWLDHTMARAMEIGQAFPGLLLALVIVARLGPSLDNAVVALGLISCPSFYRLARGLAISERHRVYVQAAQSIGATSFRILVRHILPNLASPLIVMITLRAGMLLLATGSLSFVGLGAQPPVPEWGALLATGRNAMDTAPWLAIFPGLCITLTGIGANLLGDGLADFFNPRRAPWKSGSD